MFGFHHAPHGGQNFVFRDQHVTVDGRAADVERDRIGFEIAGGAFGERGLLRDLDDAAGEQAFVQHRRIRRPTSDDFGCGRDGLEISANAADQSAAAYGHEDGIESRKLAMEFHGDGPLAGYDVQIVIGRDEHAARFFRRASSGKFGSEWIFAGRTDARAQGFDAARFGGRNVIRNVDFSSDSC